MTSEYGEIDAQPSAFPLHYLLEHKTKNDTRMFYHGIRRLLRQVSQETTRQRDGCLEPIMQIKYPEVGICGLSCRLCPSYHTEGKSKCGGCKSEYRMGAGCPFITCAVKRKGIEFCWQCAESGTCEKWRRHRALSRDHDSFVCYQKLEDNIAYIQHHGVSAFVEMQQIREHLLDEMLAHFNEGRSKRYYCVAATVLEIEELEAALLQAKKDSAGFAIKDKSKVLHAILDGIAEKGHYCLSLRK